MSRNSLKRGGLALSSNSEIAAAPNYVEYPFSELADEIIIIGERRRREAELTRPSEELTGPRALEAFQPVIPAIGATCSYKTLCYDMNQAPLRAIIPRLFEDRD